MIRIRGFARKTRRLTKGGSLPAPERELGTQSANSDETSQLNPTMGSNGHNNGNGTHSIDSIQTGNRGPASRSNGSNGNRVIPERDAEDVSAYLHRVVEHLVESKPPIEGKSPLDGNGHHSIDGAADPRLQSVFARPTVEGDAGKPMPRWKRAIDVGFILLTLPVWLPLLLLVMVWIKLVSPGPIFYRQERVGYRRRRFMIFKFRTMNVNAETRSHEEYFAHLMRSDRPMTKLDALEDNRLIRCGRFLRASGLDELPQIFNVLSGEMSLVGPRPCLPNEFQHYTPAQQERVKAPPGLTGYWQVNGKNKTTFSEMIAMDIYYAEHMSVGLDLWIILKTIPALVSQTAEVRSASELPIAPVAPAARKS